MAGVLIISIDVPLTDREAFEQWYQVDHFTASIEALGAQSARRGWSLLHSDRHVAIYEFESFGQSQVALNSPGVKQLFEAYRSEWGRRTGFSSDLVDLSVSL